MKHARPEYSVKTGDDLFEAVKAFIMAVDGKTAAGASIEMGVLRKAFSDMACGRIPVEEPVFLLRGQDALAPHAVRQWARLLSEAGGDDRLVQMAMHWAGVMESWPDRKVPDMPD